MNLLRNAVGWLNTVAKASLSDPATYTRNGFAPLTGLMLTPAETDFAVDDGTSVRIAAKQQDFTCTATDLVINGVVTLPAAKDRIQITQGDMAGTFEVGIPDNSTMPYQLDSTGLRLRIHCKRISN